MKNRWLRWLITLGTAGLFAPFWVKSMCRELEHAGYPGSAALRRKATALLWLWITTLVIIGISFAAVFLHETNVSNKLDSAATILALIGLIYLMYVEITAVRVARGKCSASTAMKIVLGSMVYALALPYLQKIVDSAADERKQGVNRSHV